MMSHVREANKNLLVKCTWFFSKERQMTICSLLFLFQRETIPVFKGRQFRFIWWMSEQCNVRGCFHIKRYIQSSTKKIKNNLHFLLYQWFVYEQNWKCSGPRYMYACIYYIEFSQHFQKKNKIIQIWKYAKIKICISTISLWFIFIHFSFCFSFIIGC